MFERIQSYYMDILETSSAHCEKLYERRIIHRYTVNTVGEQVNEAKRMITKFIESPMAYAKILRRGYLASVIRAVDQVVFLVGLPKFTDLMGYLGAPWSDADEKHYRWLDFATPCLVSRERGPCQHIFFRLISGMNQNSLLENQGIWVSLPYTQKCHMAIKMVLGKDTGGSMIDAFHGKLKMIEDGFREHLWAVPLKYIATETSGEIRHRIHQLRQHRERLGKTPVGKVIKEFLGADLPLQVSLFSAMCLPGEHSQILDPIITTLYDLVANHSVVNRRDVIDVLDLLPWKVQQRIREVRNHVLTAEQIHEEEIPDENRLQMIRVDDNTKRLAITKLRESRVKNGEGSSKASAWVNGFFRIPFGIYRQEPIFQLRASQLDKISKLLKRDIKTYRDICQAIGEMFEDIVTVGGGDGRGGGGRTGIRWNEIVLRRILCGIPKTKIMLRNMITKIYGEKLQKGIKKQDMGEKIIEFNNTTPDTFWKIYEMLVKYNIHHIYEERASLIYEILSIWKSHTRQLSSSLTSARSIMDRCIFHQAPAKEQILRILGQWMVGDSTGYCLGFEGPPGVGKTTLAREGLSKILVDDAGVPRPFHMIALGTATTGSTLVGHNYTYQGSQWGDIVRILMESECMNPIIYIDELDKVSQTENGKEIIGILTHLTDPAQNEEFQDRYFAGVKLDMSRVLFVFSYNNPELIDPILLDRIHRVHFTSLATYEKMEIVRDYTIPEIAKTLNLSPDVMKISDETLRYVIENYTYEAGVRKLREILLDTFREVNLQEIMDDDCGWLEESEGMGIRDPKDVGVGVIEGTIDKKTMIDDDGISLDFIESRILHRRSRANHRKADVSRSHNRVYGMFATERGMGGILPIRIDQDITAKDVSSFPVEITGQLGDVMKESVKISRTVAIRLLGKVPAMGLHIHFPEGAVKKDGPSAGGAITLAIWSFISKIPIPGDTAITGEIDLDGRILPVGGIREKLLGSVRDGIRRVILPEDNRRDYEIAFGELPKGECPMEIVFVRHIDEILSIFKDVATERGDIREDTNSLFEGIVRNGETHEENEREKEICHMLDMVSTSW